MQVKDTLKSLGTFTLCALKTPFYLPQDKSLAGEIKDYVDVIKRTPNPQWDCCLNVLRTEYTPVGLFSHAARYKAAEEIKMERARRILKPMIELELGMVQPEEVSVPQAKRE